MRNGPFWHKLYYSGGAAIAAGAPRKTGGFFDGDVCAWVFPRMVYVDASNPELVEGFTKKTFIAMIEGVKEEALSLGYSDDKAWNQGIADLYRTTREDGTFCYTFFQATALKQPCIL